MKFVRQRFFSAQPYCFLTLLNTYKQHHTETSFYIYYVCPCLDLDLFMSYLCDLFFFFIFIFVMTCHIISRKHTRLSFFRHILKYLLLFFDDNIHKECEYFPSSKSSALGCCSVFALFFANFSVVLLMKHCTKNEVFH